MDELDLHIEQIDKILLDAKAGAGSASLIQAPKDFNDNLMSRLIAHYNAWANIKLFRNNWDQTLYLDFIAKPKRR